jgi:hypothetical protein
MTDRIRFKNWQLWVLATITIIIFFQISYGLSALLPSNISWLMTVRHDWGQHYLGWAFYKNESWHFPIGEIQNLYYPIGTNVGFTDSIPLLAIFFKLFSKVLPEDFQYFGIWLFICHLLVAYYTIKICRLFKISDIYTFVAVLLIAANPVLIYRGLHPALCGHWLFLASIYLYLVRPMSISPKKILIYQFILLIIAGLINPYICLMVLGFTLVIPWKLCFYNKVISKNNFFIYEVISMSALLCVWYFVGLINFKGEDLSVTGAYGLYSLNLNSLYNATGFSTFLPPQQQVSWHQYEGFMYLGIGMMLLIAFLIFYLVYVFIKRNKEKQKTFFLEKTNRHLIPLLILVILLTLFSITNIVTFNDEILVKIPIPKFLKKIGEIFRASARFFWIPYYLIFLFTIITFSRLHINKMVKLGIVLIALLIQFYDTKLLITFRHLTYGSYEPPLDNKHWTTLIRHFDKVEFFPPFESHQLTQMDYQDFCYLAARLRKPINIGYVARSDSRNMKLYSDSLTKMLEEGKILHKTLYVTTGKYLDRFALILQTDSNQLNFLNGYYYIFSKNSNNAEIVDLCKTLNEKNKVTLDSAIEKVAKRTMFTETKKMQATGKGVTYYIQRLNAGKTYISIDGFAFVESTQDDKGDSIFITLSSADKFYITPSKIQSRPDVTTYFKRTYLEDAGFQTISFFNNIPEGNYNLGIAIKTKGEFTYQSTEHVIKIGIPDYAIAQKIQSLPEIGNIVYGLDGDIKTDNSFITLSGWAAYQNQGAEDCKINLFLKNDTNIYICETDARDRPDVTAAFKNKFNLNNSGFEVKLLKSSLPDGRYQVGFLLKNEKEQKEHIKFLDKEIVIY